MDSILRTTIHLIAVRVLLLRSKTQRVRFRMAYAVR